MGVGGSGSVSVAASMTNVLTSAFNPDTIRRFELATGGFSAKYGDRLSSLLLVENRDGTGSRRLGGSSALSLTPADYRTMRRHMRKIGLPMGGLCPPSPIPRGSAIRALASLSLGRGYCDFRGCSISIQHRANATLEQLSWCGLVRVLRNGAV
jgi:hypothetical protein